MSFPEANYEKSLQNSFLPQAYISSVKERVNVIETSKKDLIDIAKSAGVIKQEVILQDLLLCGGKGETDEERELIRTAAEIYLKLPPATHGDFQMHFSNCDKKMKELFTAAVRVTVIKHEELKPAVKDRLGLSPKQIQYERRCAETLRKYVFEQSPK